MEADVLAIGPYKRYIAEMMAFEYPPTYYERVPEDTVIISAVMDCVTDVASRELAKALNLHPWNFVTHQVDNRKINFDALAHLREAGQLFLYGGIEGLKAMCKEDYVFFFRPRG